MLSLGKLLELTLAGHVPVVATQFTQDGTRLRWLAEGALEVTPPASVDSRLDLLLSAGIHGNETAPIELLDRLLRDIASAVLKPRARLLLLFGNPEAIRRGERYVEQDINRLFNGRHAQSGGAEAQRAAELERLAANFFSQAGRQRLHYDLHTAIRGSRIEQFALYPWVEGRRHSTVELARLGHAGIAAVLLQNRPSITFSAYTYAGLGAEAFTLELGKARPFGHNQGLDLGRLEACLRELIGGAASIPGADALERLQLFSVSRELIKHSEDFRLHLPDSVENFSELPQGALLAEDGMRRCWVEEREARIIFPNPRVAVGLRAGLIIVPAQTPDTP